MCPIRDLYADFGRSIHRLRESQWPSILIAVLFVFNMASVINLAAISLERTHATFGPLQHGLVKKRIFGGAVAAVWITAILGTSYMYLDIFFTLKVVLGSFTHIYQYYRFVFLSSLCLMCQSLLKCCVERNRGSMVQ